MVKIKALSVKQPWANLIASGKKTIETRTWKTGFRGELLIVSSKIPKIEPAGKTVAVVKLVDCRIMRSEDEDMALCDIYNGAHAWILENIRRIKSIPIRGKIGLYDVELPGALNELFEISKIIDRQGDLCLE